LGRRVLPPRTKRLLKRLWDPNQNLSRPEALLLKQARWHAPVTRGAIPPAASFDVICFSVFDWTFRYQRPQHLMAELGARGHRVFYVNAMRDRARRKLDVQKVAPNVWQIQLPHLEELDRFEGGWNRATVEQLLDGVARMRREFNVACAVAIVQLPSWGEVATRAAHEYGWTLVYDCMDDWHAFHGVHERIAEEERALSDEVAAITVSSDALARKWSDRRVTVLRNAGDYELFATRKPAGLLADLRRPVIGYYGAIAEWFDVALMREVAQSRPAYSFVLIGDVVTPDAATLGSLPNVTLLGEKPYELMPAYLAEFDVCLIPFRITPLTQATDPVKLYEYFAQGKPVVATPLPELHRHEPLVSLAADAASFSTAIDVALRGDDALRGRRIEVAGANTWRERGKVLEETCRAASPLVSVVIVTYNNLDYTRLCIESVLKNTHAPRLEVIVVDNASSDDTRAYLETLGGVRLILNERNEGFARANNQGVAASSGDFLVLLNNDTVVPAGWSCRLLRHAAIREVGLVVSVTNWSGNESRIDVDYKDLTDMEEFASRRAAEHDGERFDIPVAAMYCVGMRRDVAERIGALDERFTIGMFEDDDYSQRVREAGLRVVCAEDAFVHHFGQASFKKLAQKEYWELFERNKRLFEEKWGRPWVPHQERKA
jgi:GT2 family glycosyltransferase/glycosyltransferase involved in cell wall biosynthesis